MDAAAVADGKLAIPGWVWGPHDRRTMWLGAVLTGLFASFLILSLYVTVHRDTPYPFGDFFALWSYAGIALTQPVADLYDVARLHAAQMALGMEPWHEYPFPYPPTFLLTLWPLGTLSYQVAFVIWIVVTLLLYLGAIGVWGRGSPALLLMALVAPTTTINIVMGQSGFLSAALLIGGLRLMDRRPALGGILLGLLTYKPQFGILVPVALVAAGRWRCIVAACATTAVLVAVASAAFGVAIWSTWLQALPAYTAWFDALTVAHPLMPTVTADLELLGVPEPATRLAQTTVALLGALLVWVAFRRLPRALAIPVLVAATCLATPHAFLYDLPMLTGAVLLLIAERQRTEAPFRLPEIVLLVLLLALPMVMVCSERHVPVSSLALALFIMIILMGGNGVMSGNPALPQGSPGTYRHDAAFGSIMDAGNKQAARVE